MIYKTIFSLLMVLFLTSSMSVRQTGTLTIFISDFRSNKGNVSVALFNNEDAFPKLPEKAVSVMFLPITGNKSMAVFQNLPAGEYAVSVYHDENNKKKMDTNFFGIPKEGVGASNNARGHLGPPKYKDAKFLFNGKSQTIQIQIVYL
jgi:uncharacterized protein (DUF2141 family)